MMNTRKGSLWLAVAAAVLLPTKAKARGRNEASAHRDDPPQRQARRRADRAPQTLRPVASPCGRHVAEVIGGAVYIDGRRVRTSDGSVFVLAAPIWRRDGRAVAWLERSRGEARVVVVDGVDDRVAPLPLALPAVAADDRVFWAGPQRIVIGPALLAPRAVATWEQ
jgi:hypothetical protein